MQKIWTIEINGQREGPFDFEDLKADARITPDTLIWKEGFQQWKQIREVPELAALFVDKSTPPKEAGEDILFQPQKVLPDDELILDYRQDPYNMFWLLIALVIISYVIFQLYGK